MKGRAFALITILSLGLLAALGVLVYDLHQRQVTAYVVTQDLAPGTSLTASMVHAISVRQGTDDFTVAQESPVGKTLAHAAHAGDVLRPDDLLAQAMVSVPISFKLAAPGLAPGDVVDIYGPLPQSAQAAAGQPVSPGSPVTTTQGVQLYGRGVVVTAVNPYAVSVPAQLEGRWAELAVSGVALTAVKSTGVLVPCAETDTIDQSESALAQIAARPDGALPTDVRSGCGSSAQAAAAAAGG
ncbi:MAG TPA: SAF domain-containing protein [Candidatus Dormibacteraeota bacterium]|nr:SAF domain-containing protein [Candidatus Dormibacteraeota bacterium]